MDLGQLRVRLRKLLRSRGRSPDDTDDLIQEAFLRLQVYCKEKPVQQPEAFLVRTALNLSVDDYRSARNRQAEPKALEKMTLIDTQPRPEEVFAAQQRLLRVKQALDTLSPRIREVFILHRVEGYSHAQISEALGIAPSTVEKHMAKAALFLDSWLAMEGDE